MWALRGARQVSWDPDRSARTSRRRIFTATFVPSDDAGHHITAPVTNMAPGGQDCQDDLGGRITEPAGNYGIPRPPVGQVEDASQYDRSTMRSPAFAGVIGCR